MQTDDANPLLAAALAYAARGWRVVPLHECLAPAEPGAPVGCSCGRVGCDSQGKHPRVKDWPKAASADASAVRDWWKRWPGANVGVAPGACSGFVFIDVDTKAGQDLLIEYACGKTEPTIAYTTGKGFRLMYAIPEGLPHPPQTHSVQLDGTEAVRFQADGGQCVMPPSLHPSGRRYEWVAGRGLADGALAPMPEWLVAEMCRPKQPVWSDAAARNTFQEGREFNAEADWWGDILGPAGFTRAGVVNGVERYTRPNKTGGVSVTVGHVRAQDGSPALHCFSGSIPQLVAGKSYDKFGAFAKLLHGGDFTKASSELLRMGFAKRKPSEPRSERTDNKAPARPRAAEWGAPFDLDNASVGAPPFPVVTLPQGLQDLCLSSAEAVGCPVDYAATHALAVAAGAIGGAFDLQVKRGFYAPSILWACVVAPPGSGKSPSVAPVLAPVFAEQATRKKLGKDKPVYVGDVTVERLARLLENDPRGLTMVWDEMAGWLTSFNQYKAKGAGNDRTHYLSIWDGRAIKVDRAGPDKPPLFVQRPRLSVVGGIQPEVLNALRDGPSDGLFDRMLFSYPPDPGLVVETFAEPDESAAAEWGRALEKIRARKPRTDPDDVRPVSVALNDAAKPLWQDWTRQLAQKAADPEAASYFRNVAAKVSGYAARIALVLKILDEGYAELAGRRWEFGVGADEMFRGITLAGYYLEHALRVRRVSGRDRVIQGAKIIRRWLAGRTEPTFTRSDLWQSMRKNSAFADPEDLDAPLERLRVHRFVRSGGSNGYEVNPAVLRKTGAPDSEPQTGV